MHFLRQPLFRRILLLLSVALFAVGGALIAIGLYNYIDESEDNPFAFLPPPSARVQPTSTVAPTQASSPVAMRIDSIQINAPVITLGVDPNSDPPAPQVPDYSNRPDDAGSVVAWYDFSAVPGSGSNAVFAAHVTWDRQPAVFWELDKIPVGDTIVITDNDGKELIYKVFANFLVDPNDPDALKVMHPTEEDTLTLITCGGQWLPNPSERFGGNYSNRVIVQARAVGAGG